MAPLEPLAVGDRFTTRDWPLHVTLVPTFSRADSPRGTARATAAAAVERAAAGLPPLTVVVGADALYGPRHTVPVSEVTTDLPLQAAHAALMEALAEGGIELETPAYAGPGFRAHVTHRKERRPRPGDVAHLTQVALVDMQPGQEEGRRAVLAVSVLTGG